MGSSCTYAFFQSAFHVPPISRWVTTNFFLDTLFQFIQCPWPSRVDPILKVAPPKRKKITNGQVRWSRWPELPFAHLSNYHCFVNYCYGERKLLTVPLVHDYWMASLSVSQSRCSAVLPTLHGCHYAFQMFPFFCFILYFELEYLCLNFWRRKYIFF